MTYPVDPSKDYLIMERPEVVLLESKLVDGTYALPVIIQYAKRTAIQHDQMDGDASLFRLGVVWNIWTDWLYDSFQDPIIPKYGDRITLTDGVSGNNLALGSLNLFEKYIVKSVAHLSLRVRYRLICARELQSS